MNAFDKISYSDITVKNTSEAEHAYIKESERQKIVSGLEQAANKFYNLITGKGEDALMDEAAARTVNTGLNLFKEAVVLQTLEARSVDHISRIKRASTGVPLARGGFIRNEGIAGNYFSSIGIERIAGEDWATHEFKSEEELIDATLKAARTLKTIYDAGFLHNDIKPGNLMVTPDNDVVVIDFNSAEPLTERAQIYASAHSLGFSAPEKYDFPAVGEDFPRCDVRSDIYSLTMVMANKLGVDSTVSVERRQNNFAPETIRDAFLDALHIARQAERITEKMYVFLMWNTAEDPDQRSQNYDEFISTLTLVQNPDVSTKELYAVVSNNKV